MDICRRPLELSRRVVRPVRTSWPPGTESRDVRAFSRAAFEKQLGVPGLVMFRALVNEEIVGLHLWYVA